MPHTHRRLYHGRALEGRSTAGDPGTFTIAPGTQGAGNPQNTPLWLGAFCTKGLSHGRRTRTGFRQTRGLKRESPQKNTEGPHFLRPLRLL